MYCKTEWRTDSLDLTGHFSIEQATNYVRCIASILFLRKSCFLNRFVKEWFMKGPKILLTFADIPPRSWCYVGILRKDGWLLRYAFCKKSPRKDLEKKWAKSVQLVRVESFRSDFLQNLYFSNSFFYYLTLILNDH